MYVFPHFYEFWKEAETETLKVFKLKNYELKWNYFRKVNMISLSEMYIKLSVACELMPLTTHCFKSYETGKFEGDIPEERNTWYTCLIVLIV